MSQFRLINQSLPSVCAAGDRAEGAEGGLDNAPAVNTTTNGSGSSATSSTKRTFGLETRFSFLNLRRQHADNKNSDGVSQKAAAGQTAVLVQ